MIEIPDRSVTLEDARDGSEVDGLRLVLASTVGARYRVKVSDDGTVVGLWRLG